MYDCFVILYDGRLLVTLTGFKMAPYPLPNDILNWYSREYAFDRNHLIGGYSVSIDVSEMKFEEFS